MIRYFTRISVMIIFLLFLSSVANSAEKGCPLLSDDMVCGVGSCQYIPTIISTGRDTALGEVIFEMDAETPTGDNQLLGVEFDGTYFYVTGGAGGADPNKVYVIDTLGNMVLAVDQPDLLGYWGWRDLCWDGAYTGTDRIDTLYGSCDQYVHKFGISFADSTLQHYGSFPGPCHPLNRALAYMEDSSWFFTNSGADSNYNYKFSKTNAHIDSSWNRYYFMYGAAYDTDVLEGGFVWWHSQNATTIPFYCLIEQMDAISMDFTGVVFNFSPTIIASGIAGGLCFYEGFRGMDVLFALVQGNPVDIIVGIFVRQHIPGIAGESNIQDANTSGLISCFPNPARGHTAITYNAEVAADVSLQIYDKTGCLVKTLVDDRQIGAKTAYWDGDDVQGRRLPGGVYFIRFETQEHRDTDKIILLR